MDKYSVSKVKTFEGREGFGFNATLLREGRPVATVMDDASGGESRFTWLDRAAGLIEFPALNHKDESVTLRGTPEEAAFWAHCLTLGSYTAYGQTMRYNPAIVVENLVNDAEVLKNVTARLKRQLKDRVLFVKDGSEFYCKPRVKGTDPLTLVEGVKQRHPGAVILNTMAFDEAVALVLGMAK